MRAFFARLASAVLLSFSGLALAAPQIIVPSAAPGPNSQARFQDVLEAGGNTAVRFNAKELQALPPESEIELSLPNATRNVYILELIQVGVRVYEYLPRFIHAKTFVVDDDLAIVGSANMDNRSFLLNFEVTSPLCPCA